MDYIDPFLNVGMFGNPNDAELLIEGMLTDRTTSTGPRAASSGASSLALVPPKPAAVIDPVTSTFPWWMVVIAIGAFLLLSDSRS